MKYRKLLFPAWIAGLVLLLGVAGVRAQDAITIKFWSHDFKPRETIDREIIAQFEKDHPNVRVEYTIGPGNDPDYITQLLTALSAGEGPDLYNVLSLVPELKPDGPVAPVDYQAMGYDSQQALVDTYVEGTLQGFMDKDGTLYGVPTELGNYALYINGDLFKAAGLDPQKDAPKTWEDLMAIAPKLTKKDASGNITQRAFDFAYPIPDEYNSGPVTYDAMAYQLGGTIFNEERTAGAINTEPWVKTFTYIRDYAKQFGGPALTPSAVAFPEGSIAMIISGTYYMDVVKGSNPDMAKSLVVAPFPRWKNGLVNDAGSYLYGYGLYVNSQSKPEVQQAAWRLAAALSSQPERYFTDTNLLQPRKSVAENTDLLNSSFAGLFIQDMKGSPSFPTVRNVTETTGIFDRALQRVLNEGMDPKESLDQANDELTAFLKE
jgi:multiple sugar transport system substrate-binding protein